MSNAFLRYLAVERQADYRHEAERGQAAGVTDRRRSRRRGAPRRA